VADDVNITVRVTDATGAGITTVRASITRLTQDADRANKSFGSLRATALSLAPALIPVAAAAAPIAVSLGAASAAVGVFGVAVGKQISAMTKASEAQQKYDDAVRQHGRTSTEADEAELEFQRNLEAMPPATRRATAALSSLKDQYTAWSDSLADDTMPVFTHSLDTLAATLEPMSPTVRAVSDELDRFVAVAAGGVSSDSFDGFMDRFDDFAAESLSKARIGLIEFVQSAQTSGVGSDVEAFLDYAQQNSPLVGDALGNLASALTNVLVGASETGVSMLGLVDALARLASAVPPELIGTLLSMYAALKLVALGVGAVSAVMTSAFIARFTTFVTTARTSGVGAAMSGMAAGMTRVQKAVGALGGLALVGIAIDELAEHARGAPPDIDRLTTSLKRLSDTGQFTGELRDAFGTVDEMTEKFAQLQERLGAEDTSFRIPGLYEASKWLDRTVSDLVEGGDSTRALEEDFEALDQALAAMASGGHAKEAADSFQVFREALLANGESMEDIRERFPEYQDTVAALRVEQELAAAGMGLFGEQALATQEALEQQKLSADGLRQSLQALNDVNRQGLDGMIAFEDAIDAASKAAEDSAGVLRMRNGELVLNSEAQREAAGSLNDLAAATDEAAASAREQGRSWSEVNDIYARGRQELVESAQAMGLTKDQARALADQILQIPDRTAQVRGDISDLRERLREARERLQNVPDSRKAEVRADIAQLRQRLAEARNDLNSLQDRNVTVTVDYVSRYLGGGPMVDESQIPGVIARASGGVVGSAATGGVRGAATLVGERGPEIVRLPFGSTVIPANTSKQWLKSEREARQSRDVASAFGVSHFGSMAGASSTAFEKSFGDPKDVKSLIGALNEWRGNVKALTHGSTERMLLKDLDVAGKALIKNARAHEKISAELDKARDKLKGLREAASQFADSVRGGVLDTRDVTEGSGTGGAFTADMVISNLSGSAAQADTFADALDKLQKRGLGKAAMRNISEAGIEGGGLETALALLRASDKEIAQINSLQKQIGADAARAGEEASDALYKAGIRAAEGVVRGLEKSQRRIERVMENLAEALERAVRKGLGIGRKASGGITGAAGGGPRSSWTLVGEHGPEIADLPFGSRVRSNPDTRRLMGGGYGGAADGRPIQINVMMPDGKVLARVLYDPLRGEIRDRGGLASLGRM
jgi:hypothetical protein